MSHLDNDLPTDEASQNTFRFHTDFRRELDSSAAGAVKPALWKADGLPSGAPLIVVRRGPNAGSRFHLTQAVTSVGRHPASDIFLDDVTASRRHAEFHLADGDVSVVDLGSLNGTYVNATKVQSAVLANGDEIQVGKFRLVFFIAPVSLDEIWKAGGVNECK